MYVVDYFVLTVIFLLDIPFSWKLLYSNLKWALFARILTAYISLIWIHLQRPCSSSSFFCCFRLIFQSFHLNLGKVYYTFQMLFFCYCSTLSAFQCCCVAKWNCFFLCNHLNQRWNHDFTFSFSWSSFISGSRGVSSYKHFTTC